MKIEIKFRAWDRAGNQMLDPKSIQELVSEVTMQPSTAHRLVFLPLVEKMAFSNQEVYEGDIVLFDTEDGIVKAEVVHKSEDKENSSWIAGFAYKVIEMVEHTDDSPIEFKVIGNIYENPELINQKSN